jgi:sodium/hydrogen exchanger 8
MRRGLRRTKARVECFTWTIIGAMLMWRVMSIRYQPEQDELEKRSNDNAGAGNNNAFSSNNQGWSLLQTTRFLGEADSFSMLIVLVVLMISFLVAFVIRSTNFRYMPEAAAALLFGVVFGGGIRLVSDIEQLQRVVLLDRETFFLILLPPIIFNGGINTKQRDFVDTIDGAILLAFIGTVVSAFVVGGILYSAVATGVIAANLSFIECMVFGSLISATDTVTVLSLFASLGVHSTLYSNVFGESALNDAVAIALYGAVIEFDHQAVTWAGVGGVFWDFTVVFAGSTAIGVGIALLSSLLFKHADMHKYPVLETALLAMYAYTSYLLAQGLGLSGIVAIFFCGLGIAHYTLLNLSHESRHAAVQMFEIVSYVFETSLFVYVGLAVFSFEQAYDVNMIVIAVLACLLGRLHVYPLLMIVNWMSPRHRPRLTLGDMTIVWYAGLRGAVCFALAMGKETLHGDLLFTTTLMVVLVTLVLMGASMMPLVSALGIRLENDPSLVRSTDEQMEIDAHNAATWLATIDRRWLKPFFTRLRATGYSQLEMSSESSEPDEEPHAYRTRERRNRHDSSASFTSQ